MPSHVAVRDAVMGLVHDGCVPRALVLTLLFHIIPFLEAPVLAFSLKDVQALMRWLTDVSISQVRGQPPCASTCPHPFGIY